MAARLAPDPPGRHLRLLPRRGEDNIEAYAAGGADVTIGSIDTGVDFTHPEFTGRLIPGRGLVLQRRRPERHADNGTLFIASAGNAGTARVACPACDVHAISVAATNWRDELAAYGWMQGTSMAAPQVTGTAAVVASKTGLRGAARRNHILSTADDKGAAGYDTKFGAGRVNTFRAVTGTSLIAGQ